MQGDAGGLTLQTCSTSVSCPSSRRARTPSSLEGFAPLIVPWRQDKQISNGTGFLPAAVFRSREVSINLQQGDGRGWPYGQLIRLTPLALPFPHQLPSLFDPRECSTTADVGNHLEGYLAAHAQTRAILPRKYRVDVRVEVGKGKIRVRRDTQARQRQVHDTSHKPHDFRLMVRIEMTEVSFGICDCRGNVRGVTFDEEMEISCTVELELERRLTRLQKLPVPLYPPKHKMGK